MILKLRYYNCNGIITLSQFSLKVKLEKKNHKPRIFDR